MSNAISNISSVFKRNDVVLGNVISINHKRNKSIHNTKTLDTLNGYITYKSGFRNLGDVELRVAFARSYYDLILEDFENNNSQKYSMSFGGQEFVFYGFLNKIDKKITSEDAIKCNINIKLINEADFVRVISALVSSGISFSENLSSSISSVHYGSGWVEVAPTYGGAKGRALVTYSNSLYGGTWDSGELLLWNDVNAWTQKAPILNSQNRIYELLELNEYLYASVGAGSGGEAQLFKWNGTNNWTEVAGQPATSDTQAKCSVVWNDEIYMGTEKGNFFKWNGTDAWTLLSSGHGNLAHMIVFNNNIYIAGYDLVLGGARLLKYDGISVTTVSNIPGNDETGINRLYVYNNTLYAGTQPTGRLFEYNGINTLVEVAEQYDENSVYIYDIIQHGDYLYGLLGNSGILARWNESDAWILEEPQTDALDTGLRLCSHSDGYLYGYGYTSGKLYRWE
ncbi:MAG: hypothetical protein ACTSYH_03605 [Candidatus Heimdallarchaeaceae archaeon]